MSLLSAIGEAAVLIVRGDQEVWRVTAVSLQVSIVALTCAAVAGIPVGYRLALSRRRSVSFASWVLHTLAALPTVVVGLGLYFAFSVSGPLGWMELLYTRTAMIAGQFVLAVPIVAALTLTAVRNLPRETHETALTLRITAGRKMLLMLREAQPALISAILIGFARIFTELGAAVILGGNIRGHTRTLTTVIALEYSKGDDARAIAMGLVLLMVALAINALVHGSTVWRVDEP
jgi:tungstate transport system permease protein